MNLYLVTDHDRWGYSMNIVRARDSDHAKELACPNSKRFDCERLEDDGTARILWCHDESPDSPLDRDY